MVNMVNNLGNLLMAQNEDGKDYYFKSFFINALEDIDILADALAELGEVTHVRITAGAKVKIQVNGSPASSANGKTIPTAQSIGLAYGLIGAWEARMLFTSLHAYGASQATIEVEYWNTHSD